jgi:hypothetical protein
MHISNYDPTYRLDIRLNSYRAYESHHLRDHQRGNDTKPGFNAAFTEV